MKQQMQQALSTYLAYVDGVSSRLSFLQSFSDVNTTIALAESEAAMLMLTTHTWTTLLSDTAASVWQLGKQFNSAAYADAGISRNLTDGTLSLL